jgi:hypothetical protein
MKRKNINGICERKRMRRYVKEQFACEYDTTVGAQSIARSKYSAPAFHLCYNAKKTEILKILFGKTKKEEFSKMTFFSLIGVLPVVYCGCGEISPTVKPNSRS